MWPPQDSAQLVEGEVPIVSTMVDAAGNPIAWIYTQRRWVVPGDRIADTMKLAIVSIEDRRFGEHNGVDVQGSLTGLAGYLQGADDTRGGSTIEQQYVKNYNLLVHAPRPTPSGGRRSRPRRCASCARSGWRWNSTRRCPSRRS